MSLIISGRTSVVHYTWADFCQFLYMGGLLSVIISGRTTVAPICRRTTVAYTCGRTTAAPICGRTSVDHYM